MLGNAPHSHRPGAIFTTGHHLTGIFLLLVQGLSALAAVPETPGERAQLIGQPTALMVQPASLVLHGSRDLRQIVVTGRYSDGSVRDLTPLCGLSTDSSGIVAVGGDGLVVPRQNGSTILLVSAGERTVGVPIAVNNFDEPQPVRFRQDVIATLNVGGCNAGACHGSPSGKNGFRLSLRGYDPTADFLQLTHDVHGRRTDRLAPESSLILQKALARVSHEGGARFSATSVPAQMLRGWLNEGLHDDPANQPALKRIEIIPGTRVLHAPGRWQQLAVHAEFADGSVRDVTRLTVFSSSDEAVAGVSTNGLVEFRQSGEVAILCRYLEVLQPIRLTYLESKQDFEWSNPSENNYVDSHVFAKLRMLSIQPSALCADQEFLRRAYLDLCGILPGADEVRAFLANTGKDKRIRLIDSLLERPEYADFWTLKWSDVLRSKRKTIQLKGIHVYQHWLRGHIGENTPFDRVVRELLTASGSSYTNPPANFYRVARDPQSLAETTAQLFFGIRMQCAKCHNHPFERWTQDDYYSLAAFFARVKQRKDPLQSGPTAKDLGAEVVYTDRAGEVVQPRTGKVMSPRIMGGSPILIPPGKDRREVLADAIISASNPFFARSIANRVWYHLNGRGIVDPVDDFRDSNPAANDELLDALARDFVAHQFDVKHLIRVIMNSRIYQLSAEGNDFNREDNKYFSHAVTKLLTAEQLLDALCAVTEVPEKYAGMPLGTRAAQLPDGEVNNPFLKTFGQPARELACECEREGDSNLTQALELITGPTVSAKLRNPKNRVGRLLEKKLSDAEILNELYLATISRPPLKGEVEAALDHIAKAGDKRKAWEDVQWALFNAKEFLFRH